MERPLIANENTHQSVGDYHENLEPIGCFTDPLVPLDPRRQPARKRYPPTPKSQAAPDLTVMKSSFIDLEPKVDVERPEPLDQFPRCTKRLNRDQLMASEISRPDLTPPLPLDVQSNRHLLSRWGQTENPTDPTGHPPTPHDTEPPLQRGLALLQAQGSQRGVHPVPVEVGELCVKGHGMRRVYTGPSLAQHEPLKAGSIVPMKARYGTNRELT